MDTIAAKTPTHIDVPNLHEGSEQMAITHALFDDRSYVVKQALEAGGDANTRDVKGNTPLHRAVESSVEDNAKVQHLLAHGANPNAQNDRGETPLHLSAGSPIGVGTEALLQAGADPSIRDARGATPLIAAKSAKNVDLLLDYGADIHARTLDGDNALHVASRMKASESIDRLIERGADHKAVNNAGKTPMDLLPEGHTSPAIEGARLRDAAEHEVPAEAPGPRKRIRM